MKKITLVLILYLISDSVQIFSQGVSPASTPKAITNFLGLNGQNNITGSQRWIDIFTDAAAESALEALSPSTIRYPGGNVSNWFDWKKGNFINPGYSFNSCYGLPDDYHAAYLSTIAAGGGNEMNYYRDVMNRHGFVPVLVLNMLTSDMNYQLGFLYAARVLNMPVQYVELGCEFYSGKCEDNEVFLSGTDYAQKCIPWIQVIRQHFPNTMIAVVGATSDAADSQRRRQWMSEVLNEFNNHPVQDRPDAIVPHHYSGSGLGQGARCDNPPGAGQNIDNVNEMEKMMVQPFWAMGIVNNTFNPCGSLINQYGILNDPEEFPAVQNYNQNNPGNPIETWYTEYDLFDRENAAHGKWAHGLYAASQTLALLADMYAAQCNFHAMTGSATFAAFIGKDDFAFDLSTGDEGFCSTCPGISSTLSQYNYYDFTAAGHALSMIGNAMRNASDAYALLFNNIPCLDVTPDHDFQSMYGWYFTDGVAQGEEQAVMINMSDQQQNLTINAGTNPNWFQNGNCFYEILTYNGGTTNDFNHYIAGTSGYDPMETNPCSTAILNGVSVSPPQLFTPGTAIAIPAYSVIRLYYYPPSVQIIAINDNGCGEPVSLRATGDPAWSYTWEYQGVPFAATQSATVTGPVNGGQYDVTVTNTPFGTLTQSITLTVNSSSPPVVTGNQVICPGSSVTLSAALQSGGNANFVWINSNGQGVQNDLNATQSQVTVSPSQTTTYTVYVNDGTCFQKQDVTVDVAPVFDFDPNPVQVCTLSTGNEIIAPAMEPTTATLAYLWNTGVTTSSITVQGISALPAYTVTVTANGTCAVTKSVSVLNVECCTTGTGSNHFHFYDPVTETQLLNMAPCFPPNLALCTCSVNTNGVVEIIRAAGGNPRFHFHDDLIIEGKLQLEDFGGTYDFEFSERAELIVKSYGSLTLKNSDLNGCSSRLWKGIHNKEKSKVSLFGNSNVAGAEYGNRMNNWVDYRFVNSTFDRNRIHVYTEAIPNAAPNNSTGTMHGMTFDRTTALPLPYTGQTTATGTTPLAGIWFNNTIANIGVAGQNMNVFRNLNAGVVGEGSVLNILNTRFENILPDNAYISYHGMGIGSVSNHLYSSLSFTGLGTGTADFNNCTEGVNTTETGTHVSGSVMTNVASGATVLGNFNLPITISSNNITASLKGIDLQSNDGFSVINITGNSITINDALQLHSKQYGIRIWENNVLNVRTFRVLCNTVNMQMARYGFHLQGANGIYLKENTVLSNDPAFNIQGWFMGASDYNSVIMNYIGGVSGNIQNNDAFTLSIANYNRIINNSTNHTRYGYNFQGLCTDSYFLGNTNADHYTGLHLNSSGIMGTQFHRGNKWYGTYSHIILGNQIGAVNENNSGNPFDILQSQFKIHTQIGTVWHPYNNVPNQAGVQWFLYDPTGSPSSIAYQSDCHIPDEQKSASIGLTDSLIVTNSLSAVEFENETKWMGSRSLAEKLGENDSLKTINSFFEAYYDSVSLTGIGKLNAFHQLLREAWNNSSQLAREIVTLDSIARALLEQINLLNSSLAVANDSYETAALAEEKIQLQSQLRYIAEQANSKTAEYRSSLIASIEAAEAENNMVVASGLTESNEKTVNRIKAKFLKWGKDSITCDAVELYSIAVQCPLSGGKAVYVARSLYNLINTIVIYDDEAVCAMEGYFRKKNDPANFEIPEAVVFPNPASTKFNIRLKIKEDQIALLKITNAHGKVVLASSISASDWQKEYDVSHLQPEIYSVEIILPERVSVHNKLAIIR